MLNVVVSKDSQKPWYSRHNLSLVILLVYLHMSSPSIDERISHKFHTR